MKKTILYLRTDLLYDELTAGGSVGHTLGVIQGFLDVGFDVIAAVTNMVPLIKKLPIKKLKKIKRPALLRLLRWRVGSFIQTFTAAWQTRKIFQTYQIQAIYQRYSILNFTGILLSWWFRKKLILEYNGSEAWVVQNWSTDKEWSISMWFIKRVELLNIEKADFITVVSEVLKKELIDRGVGQAKILVNPNGVDPQKFTPEKYFVQGETECSTQL